ncbi:MAG: 4Fe-4S binding protein [bacterium]
MEKTLILRFSKKTWNKPVIHGLSKSADLVFNILEAKVLPRQEAYAIMKLEGQEDEFEKGLEFLKTANVVVEEVPDKVLRDEESCMHCGTCTATCPSGALSVGPPPDFEIPLDLDLCVACGTCVKVCPVNAMQVFVI